MFWFFNMNFNDGEDSHGNPDPHPRYGVVDLKPDEWRDITDKED